MTGLIRKRGKRAVESAVLSGVNLKIHPALRQRTLQPGAISNFGLEILGIRRCALRVGWYWSARERLLQLFADAINVRPPSSLAAIALWLAPVMMRSPISVAPVESVGTIGAEPRSVVAIGRANNHANYWRRRIEDRSRRWWRRRVIVPWRGSAVRLNHLGASIRARSRCKAQYEHGGCYHS